MKSLTIVIPTMKRNDTGLNYFKQCIDKSDLSSATQIYIFIDKILETEISTICKNINHKYIYRSENDKLYKNLSKF